jgi:hypothetical protein
MDTITITVAENDPDVIVSATLNEDAVTIVLNEAAVGATGAGVAAGGSANDILKKTSATNYATAWETPTSAATANTVVRRDASGGAAFDVLQATILYTGSIQSSADNAFISTTGEAAEITTEGDFASIGTSGPNATITTGGVNAHIATLGANSAIYTLAANSPIYTSASDSNIETQNASASVRSYNFAAIDATAGASLRNSAGTAVLTWGATAGNISITVNTTSTGHFFSNPSTSEAGHFLTKNGTTPTIAAGRSAWFSDSSGSPQFKNGTGSALTLIYNGGALGTPSSGTLTNCTGLPVTTGISGLGTNVAAFLETPTSANLAAAITDETGSGALVFATSPTITTPTITRGSVGLVATLQDNNGASATMTTDSSGRNFFNINGKSGAVGNGGAYVQLTGYEEAWTTLNVQSNTSGQRVMRFGTLSNRFSIQRLNDGISSITATPFSFANNAPTNSFYMLTSGTVGFGTSTPSEKALLDLTSTTKGFLPPRMTTTERNAITSPVAGLMIYNTTTNKLNVYTTAWEAVTSA